MRTSSLLLLLAISTPAFGQSAQNSPPLSDSEKRTVLLQLYELKACRESVSSYRDYVSRETEQDAREKANYERSLELEKQATSLAQKERDLAMERAAFYEQAFKGVTKKPSLACKVFSAIFTLGIHRCN